MLSGYRIMWLMVMFDLPVLTKGQRKAAAGFRNSLLDFGFEMSQYSVYLRFCSSQTQADTWSHRVQLALPPSGRVSILTFTDKQYERITSFHGAAAAAKKIAPTQLEIF